MARAVSAVSAAFAVPQAHKARPVLQAPRARQAPLAQPVQPEPSAQPVQLAQPVQPEPRVPSSR